MKNKNKDWTEPPGLNMNDWARLKDIKQLYEEGNLKAAMALASSSDTVIREAIPPRIWLNMGGTLIRAGWKGLRKNKRKGSGRDIE